MAQAHELAIGGRRSHGESRGPLRVAWFGHAGGRRADGLSTYSAQTVRALRGRGVALQFFSHRQDGPLAPAEAHVQLRSWRFKTVTIPAPGSRRRVARALRCFAPDVAHISVSFSLLDGWIVKYAQRAGIGTVATVHLPYASPHSGRGFVLRQLYRFQARWLRHCDLLIALSQEQRALLIRFGCAAGRITVIPNGVDTDRIAPGASRLRAQLGARFVVAYVGRLDPEKRVASLVRAFASLRWPQDHVLIIAGSGAREREVRRLAAAHDNIHLLGALRDVDQCADALRATDIFVLPSTAEGLSLSMLEAMAAGCAVVATDVAEDGAALGDAGITIPVHPIEPGIAAALRRLREDEQLRGLLRQRARLRAEGLFALSTRAETLLRLYESLRRGAAAAA